MHKKALWLLFIALLGFTAVRSQDKLYKNNGDVLSVKVKHIEVRTISYTMWDNQDGPEYTINKNEVDKIIYQNGNEEKINSGPRRPGMPHRAPRTSTRGTDKATPAVDYGRSIFSLAPIEMNNTSATGVGISYEIALDPGYRVSFVLPFTYSFRTDGTLSFSSGSYSSPGDANVFWLAPGLKFYPSGSNHMVTYAIGVNFPYVWGREPVQGAYDPLTGLYAVDHVNVSMIGIIVNNYLNIMASKHLYFGMNLGFGIPYYKSGNDGDKYYGRGSNMPLVNFGLRFGARF